MSERLAIEGPVHNPDAIALGSKAPGNAVEVYGANRDIVALPDFVPPAPGAEVQPARIRTALEVAEARNNAYNAQRGVTPYDRKGNAIALNDLGADVVGDVTTTEPDPNAVRNRGNVTAPAAIEGKPKSDKDDADRGGYKPKAVHMGQGYYDTDPDVKLPAGGKHEADYDESVEPVTSVTNEGGNKGGNKPPKTPKGELFDDIKEDLGKDKGLGEKEAKALKDARDRYVRIAARRDAVSTLTLNGKDKNEKGNTKKLLATAEAELLTLRTKARTAMRTSLEASGKYTKDQIEDFLRVDDTKFAIKTSKKITKLEIKNFEDKLPATSLKRKLVQKWKSWGKYEMASDGTYKTDPKTGERVLKSRGKRVTSFLKKAGTVVAAGVIPALIVGPAITGGALGSGKVKMNHMAERVDHAKERHARLKKMFTTNGKGGIAQTHNTGNFTETALGEITQDVNKYVRRSRRNQIVGTLGGVAAGILTPYAIHGVEHLISGNGAEHVATINHPHQTPHNPHVEHHPVNTHEGGPVGHHATTNADAYPWTVAHNMNALDHLHTNEMGDIHHVINSLNAKGSHYGLIPTQNGNFVQLAYNGHPVSAGQLEAFNHSLINYMNTLADKK